MSNKAIKTGGDRFLTIKKGDLWPLTIPIKKFHYSKFVKKRYIYIYSHEKGF